MQSLFQGEAHFYDLNGDEIEKETTEIKWDAEAAEKAGFEHFMMKEIYEQPKAIRDTLNSVVKDGVIDFTDIDITEEEIKKYSQIYIVACGSAWHVGVEAQYVIEELAQIPVRVELASEFRYREMPLVKDGLVIVISQSGETADTLAAMRMAKDKGLAYTCSCKCNRKQLLPVRQIRCSIHWQDRRFRLLQQRDTAHSL